MNPPQYPFTAVVGQDRLKRALLINAVDPLIGGVLIKGQKGSAKTTMVRGLAQLLGSSAPLVELPLGCGEDRLLGSFDLERVLKKRQKRFVPGLLSQADGGILYVDEVNLLGHHLVDLLLDAAASGFVRVEREGFSLTRPARFVLVGSMNPEEGELRPQLLDRFGLSVETETVREAAARLEVARRRLAFDADPAGFRARWKEAEAALLATVRQARAALSRLELSDGLAMKVAALCADAGIQGMRADMVIYRASRALAALAGRQVESADVDEAALLALPHRGQRHLSQPEPKSTPKPGSRPSTADAPGQAASADPGSAGDPAGGDAAAPEARHEAGAPQPVRQHLIERSRRPGSSEAGRRQSRETSGLAGAAIGERPYSGATSSVAWEATVKSAAGRPSAGTTLAINPADLKEHIRDFRTGALVLFVVDASGSMHAGARMKAAKTAALSLLVDAYQRRDHVGLIAFRGEEAQLLLPPTRSLEAAEKALADLPTGGRTPLAAGLRLAEQVISRRPPDEGLEPFVVLITDGRPSAASGEDPLAETLVLAQQFRKRRIAGLVVDTESGAARLGYARRIAERWGVQHVVPESL